MLTYIQTDRQQGPTYPISSPLSLWLRWAKKLWSQPTEINSFMSDPSWKTKDSDTDCFSQETWWLLKLYQYFRTGKLKINQHNTFSEASFSILSFWTDSLGKYVDPDCLIRAYTVCYYVCIVLTHYSMVRPNCSFFSCFLWYTYIIISFCTVTPCHRYFSTNSLHLTLWTVSLTCMYRTFLFFIISCTSTLATFPL